MVSDRATMIFTILLIVIVFFFVWSLKKRQQMHLMHKLYLFLMSFFAIWILALIGMRFTPEEHTTILFILDCITQSGNFCAVSYLCIYL